MNNNKLIYSAITIFGLLVAIFTFFPQLDINISNIFFNHIIIDLFINKNFKSDFLFSNFKKERALEKTWDLNHNINYCKLLNCKQNAWI